jgi:hypothetical protein
LVFGEDFVVVEVDVVAGVADRPLINPFQVP